MEDFNFSLIAIFIIIIQFGIISGYEQNNAELGSIPHDSISSEEVTSTISLTDNQISMLDDNEFSQYTSLKILLLSNNFIYKVSATAFQGTILQVLDLSDNELTTGPDLSSIGNTLTDLLLHDNLYTRFVYKETEGLATLDQLNLRGNTFEEFPKILSQGNKLIFSSNGHIPETGLQSVCMFSTFVWLESQLTNAPVFKCQTSNLKDLNLRLNSLDENSDMSGLESIASSIQALHLQHNQFNSFPALPMKVRESLINLDLDNNKIASIPETAILSFSLKYLTIKHNRLTTIPSYFIQISKRFILKQNPLSNLDQFQWNQMIMAEAAYRLEKILMGYIFSSLSEMPDISEALCKHPNMIQLGFSGAIVPCDCSIQWLADSVKQQCCEVTAIETIYCDGEVKTLHELDLHCPDNFLMHYPHPDFEGEAGLVESQTTFTSLLQPQSIIISGTRPWKVKLVNNNYKILLPGRYNIAPISVQPFTPTVTVSRMTSPTLSPSNFPGNSFYALFDENWATCINLPHSTIMTLELDTSNGDYSKLKLVTTERLDCSEEIHVLVTVGEQGGSACRGRLGCRLVRHRYNYITFHGRHYCEFDLPHSTDLALRLISVGGDSGLCDIKLY